jgi:large subunit ribosomal protein L4e
MWNAGGFFSAKVSKRRRDYRGCYGKGISRAPRKVMSKNGSNLNWVGAMAPGTRGGRQAHPPRSAKVWDKKINTKERRKAIRSALSASLDKATVQARGHKVPSNYPFIISKDFENLDKTNKVEEIFNKLGLTEELGRSKERKVRAGKGKMRGRKYQSTIGPLIVVGENCKLTKSCINVAGVDIITVNHINVKMLAPGGIPGRITLFTESAIEKLAKNKLFE